MPFVGSYSKAMSILTEIGNGKCVDRCKSVWIRNFKYALKTKSNPLKLTRHTRQKMTQKLAEWGFKIHTEAKFGFVDAPQMGVLFCSKK